ncbi:hypothetical protein ACHAXT_003293 [Thalassiosira profunda]
MQLLTLLLLTVGASAGSPPVPNDHCLTATNVAPLPYSTSGCLAGATVDSFSVACLLHSDDFFVYQFNSTGLWYKIHNVTNGTELMAEVKGKESEVKGHVMMTTEQNECPEPMQCVAGLAVASSVSTNNSIPAVSFHWSASAGEIYYLYVYSPNNNSTPGYDLSVRAVGGGQSFPAHQSFLRTKQ